MRDSRFKMIFNGVFFSGIMGLKSLADAFFPKLYRTIGWFLVGYFLVDMKGLQKIYIVHHLFSLGTVLTCLGARGANIEKLSCVKGLINMEISTIFLNFYELLQINVLGCLFVITFIYYRIMVFARLMFLEHRQHKMEVFSICNDNAVLWDRDFCVKSMNVVFYFYFALNSYWGFLVVRKAVKMTLKSS